MYRFVSLTSTFLAAALTVTAGLAAASTPDDQEGRTAQAAQPEGASETEIGPELPALLPPVEDGLPGVRADVDWQADIEARLAALTQARVELPAAEAHGALARQLGRMVTAAPGGARVAVHVRDLDTGEVLFDHGGTRQLNPASNQKIATTVAAVELLGADYRFETRVYRHGDALYLVGEGDPSLQIDDLYGLAATVTSTDLESATRLVIDDSAFSPERFGPGYDPEGPGFSYMAPSGALSLAFNTIEVRVSPGEYKAPVEVSVQPESTHIKVANGGHTGGTGLFVETRKDGEHTEVVVHGAMPAGANPRTIRRRIQDPGLFTGGAFATLLARQTGTETLPVSRGTVPEGAELVSIHRSEPLAVVLGSAMKYSNNFTTEQTLRTLAWRLFDEPGSWDNGRLALERYWRAVGTDPDGFRFVNGSGLSREGRATPRALVDMLARTRRQGTSANELLTAMAGPGGEGTLHHRLYTAKGRVKAKTGTIGGVSTLSGVIATEDGERMVGFSILVNGAKADPSRDLQDDIVMAVLHHVDRL